MKKITVFAIMVLLAALDSTAQQASSTDTTLNSTYTQLPPLSVLTNSTITIPWQFNDANKPVFTRQVIDVDNLNLSYLYMDDKEGRFTHAATGVSFLQPVTADDNDIRNVFQLSSTAYYQASNKFSQTNGYRRIPPLTKEL